VSSRRCLLTVHAHPDDESSKGASTLAKYRAEGRATEIIGFSEVVMLGYRDSGMADSEGNNDPASFHQADLDEAVGRLVAVIRRERPQVIITYGDDQQGYPHPDHLKVHDITVPAFDRAGDPAWYPEAGEPWEPQKLYYSVWSRERAQRMHARFLELGIESPYSDEWLNRPWQDHRVTTRVHIGDYHDVRTNALLAHATQIDPTSSWWFGLPEDDARTIYPFEDYTLARSRVEAIAGEDLVGALEKGASARVREEDLFFGVR
jgi:mycothiol S-conjugate amidase